MFGQQQRDVAVGARVRHPHIREVVVWVDHRDPLGAHLGHEPRQLGDAPRERGPLTRQVGGLRGVELVVVEHGIVEQASREVMAQRAVAQLLGFGQRVGGKLGESLGEVLSGDRRGPAWRGEHHREHPSLYVVERVAGVAHERLLLAGHAGEHSELEQQPHDRHEVRALLASFEAERNARLCEALVGGCQDHAFGEAPEGDLRIGALEHRQGEAREHVTPAAEWQARARLARRVGRIVDRGRELDQSRDLAVDDQPPARVRVKPRAQLAGVAPDEAEVLRLGAAGA